MSGSTFLNFFLLSIIEGPAYFLGVWMAVSFFTSTKLNDSVSQQRNISVKASQID